MNAREIVRLGFVITSYTLFVLPIALLLAASCGWVNFGQVIEGVSYSSHAGHRASSLGIVVLVFLGSHMGGLLTGSVSCLFTRTRGARWASGIATVLNLIPLLLFGALILSL